MLTVGRITFEPRSKTLVISEPRRVTKDQGTIGVKQMLQAIGINIGPVNWPLPCLDMNELHRRNAERVRARLKRKG